MPGGSDDTASPADPVGAVDAIRQLSRLGNKSGSVNLSSRSSRKSQAEMIDFEHRVPVAEEVLVIEKREVPTGHVRIETRTETVEEIAEASVESAKSR